MADMTSTPPASKKSPMGRGLRIVLITGVLLVVLYQLTAFAVGRKLSSTREALEGDQSLDIGDYLPPPELAKDAINATDYFEAAALISDGQEQVYQPRSGPPPADLVAVHRHFRRAEVNRERPTQDDLEHFRVVVERYALTLQILDQGLANATDARYMTDYEVRPYEVIIPNLLIRLRFSFLLRARAELAVHDGRPEDAWGDATRIFQLAHWTTDDIPTLINTLVARAIAHQGALLTQTLLSLAPANAEIRAPVEEWALKVDTVQAINRMLDAERAVAFDFLLDPYMPIEDLDAFKDLDAKENPSAFQRLLFGHQPWQRLNAAVFLEAATRRFEACATTSYLLTEEQRETSEIQPPEWALPARAQYFDCTDVGRKRDLWLATQHLLAVAMKLENVREATGQYPDQLTDSPTDPYSGAPYKYRREGDGYVLYSVSADGQDDGGTLSSANDKGFADLTQGDLVWQVEKAQELIQ